jgi:hypothetical protein
MIVTVLLLLACAVAFRYGAWPSARRYMRQALRWGLVVGGVGFALGFFGPMIFAPDANQGPMLGIFITGPLGFLVGLVVGFIRGSLIREG